MSRVRKRFPRTTRIRWGMFGVFAVLVALILPKDFVPEYSFEQGKPWVAPALVAEFDFSIEKLPTALEADRKAAVEAVPLVFEADTSVPGQVKTLVQDGLDIFFRQLEDYRLKGNPEGDENVRTPRELFRRKYDLDPEELLSDYPDPKRWYRSITEQSERFVEKVYANGLIDTSKTSLGSDVVYVRTSQTTMFQTDLILGRRELNDFIPEAMAGLGLSGADELLLKKVVIPMLVPDLRFSPFLTEAERSYAASQVSEVKGKIKKGETIISQGERVREAAETTLRSYLNTRAERFGRKPFLVTFSGQLFLVTLLTFLLALFLRTNRLRIYTSNRKLAFSLLVLLFMVGIVVMVLKLTTFTQDQAGLNYIFLAPVCMVSVIFSAFFDARFAFFGNLIIAVLAGSIVPNGFEYLFIQLCGGTAAVYSITRLRNRADFFIALSLILFTYVVSYLAYNFYSKGSFFSIEYQNLILFGLNVLLTLITYPLIYVFEKIFGLTSDLTFIELLDTNHPLLKDMSVRAPGTFQHSIQVANIAEAVINRIGGNSLQIKVGALFHDIGKMSNPSYFIENLGDQDSPHGEMSCRESSEIIIEHVHAGVKLAHDYNLPTEVIDFIKTHHGTTRTEYFFRKYCNEHPDEEVDQSTFSYPGPLPFTREMAVLMIADSCEAASRSLKDRSPEKLKGLVNGIVTSKVQQEQFSKSSLTFRDLEDAKKVVFNMLVSIYHGRIEYPEERKLIEETRIKAPKRSNQ